MHTITGFAGDRLRRQRLATWAALVLVVLAAWFGSLELRGLFIPDEGRYAEIPREMLVSGDWITPRLNDLKYFEKPPLQYWLTAISYRLFGEDEWTARLPSALLGLFALLMVGYTGYRLRDARSGVMAAGILGTSWGYFLAGQYLTLDMTLTACLAFVLCAFVLAQIADDRGGRRAWMMVAWVAMALAVLAKGLVALVLPAGALLAYLALRRERSVLAGRLHPLAGATAFALIAVPWFVLVQQRNPEFFHFFFVYEHFQRFAEDSHHRGGAWWYYAPVLAAGLMPWTPALVKEALDWYRRPRQQGRGFSPQLFCALWIAVVVLFFSISRSKLPAYVLPAFPAVALLLASSSFERAGASLAWSAWGSCVAGLMLLGAVHWLPHDAKFAALGAHAVAQTPWLYAAAAVLGVAGVIAVHLLRRRRLLATMAVLLIGSLGFWQLVFGFLHAIDADFSAERLIEGLTGDYTPFRPEAPFYSVAQFDHSVPFYLGRTVTLVATRSELGPGIDADPHKVIASIERFEQVWREQRGQAFAVMRPDLFETLGAAGVPMVLLASGPRLLVVARRQEEPAVAPARRGWRSVR